jgi:hypothetical protein
LSAKSSPGASSLPSPIWLASSAVTSTLIRPMPGLFIGSTQTTLAASAVTISLRQVTRRIPHGEKISWRQFETGPLVISEQEIIVIGVDHPTTSRVSAIIWLLCAILVCLATYSPHCDLCDGPIGVAPSLPQILANHPLTAAPDGCNGVCRCCGLHWLPNPDPVLVRVDRATSQVLFESASSALELRSPIFRPPRIPISS